MDGTDGRIYYIDGGRERPNCVGCVKGHTKAFRPRERSALTPEIVLVLSLYIHVRITIDIRLYIYGITQKRPFSLNIYT